MKAVHKMSILLVVAAAAVGLTGCENPATALSDKITDEVMGEGSGSGELVTMGKKTFESGEFDSIDVDTQAMRIFVTKSADDHAEVELLTDKQIENKFTFDAAVQSKTLEVKVEEEDTDASWFSLKKHKGERKLVISLPEKDYKKLVVRNDAGHIEATDVKADNVDFVVQAGAIRVNRVSGEMNLKTDAGQIEVEALKLENDLTAKTDAGAIKIHLAEQPAAAEIDLESDVGKVTADLQKLDYDTKSRDHVVGSIGSGGPSLNAHTDAGTISVDVK